MSSCRRRLWRSTPSEPNMEETVIGIMNASVNGGGVGAVAAIAARLAKFAQVIASPGSEGTDSAARPGACRLWKARAQSL